MVAIYDYNPELQSPQDNPDSELAFRKGHLLTVIGEVVSPQFICIPCASWIQRFELLLTCPLKDSLI